MVEQIPVTILTGYLGSGKSTLLNALLAHPAMQETAVLINEFGPVSIDHLLVGKVDENIVLLESGCLCCSIRGDLITAMRDLFIRRAKGEVPDFQRMVIETTGLADPAPIVHSLRADPLLDARYRLDGIVTMVDAVHGSAQLDRHEESRRQVAIADRLVISKTDLVEDDRVAALEQRLAHVNPAAMRIHAVKGEVHPSKILDAGLFGGSGSPDPERWLNSGAFAHHDHRNHDDHHVHDPDHFKSFCLHPHDPVNWSRFVEAMELLMATQSDGLLRVKGVLNVADADHPVAVHGIQHIFHPPVSLPHLSAGAMPSTLVFITHMIGEEAVRKLFSAVLEDTTEPVGDR